MQKITNLVDYKKEKDLKTQISLDNPFPFSIIKLEDLKSKFHDADKFLLEESNYDLPDEVA
jgi:hypothetical protein